MRSIFPPSVIEVESSSSYGIDDVTRPKGSRGRENEVIRLKGGPAGISHSVISALTDNFQRNGNAGDVDRSGRRSANSNDNDRRDDDAPEIDHRASRDKAGESVERTGAKTVNYKDEAREDISESDDPSEREASGENTAPKFHVKPRASDGKTSRGTKNKTPRGTKNKTSRGIQKKTSRDTKNKTSRGSERKNSNDTKSLDSEFFATDNCNHPENHVGTENKLERKISMCPNETASDGSKNNAFRNSAIINQSEPESKEFSGIDLTDASIIQNWILTQDGKSFALLVFCPEFPSGLSNLKWKLTLSRFIVDFIKGEVYGAKEYDNGALIETDPVVDVTKVNDQSMVETDSGRKYWLDGKYTPKEKGVIDIGVDLSLLVIDFIKGKVYGANEYGNEDLIETGPVMDAMKVKDQNMVKTDPGRKHWLDGKYSRRGKCDVDMGDNLEAKIVTSSIENGTGEATAGAETCSFLDNIAKGMPDFFLKICELHIDALDFFDKFQDDDDDRSSVSEEEI